MAVQIIAFHITDRCQLNCQHCLRDPALKATDIDVETVDLVLSETAVLFGPTEVSFTGGEPTLHPRFIELADTAVHHGNTWHFVSNGARFPKALASIVARPERLERLSYVAFSLDGATERTHDSIRGAGSFAQVMSAISAAVVHGIPFHIRMTPNRQNEHELEDLAFLAGRLGAAHVLVNALQPTGTLLDRSLFLPYRELLRIADRVAQINEVLTIPVACDAGFATDDPVHMCSPFKSEALHFDMHGNMNLCCRFSGVPLEGGASSALVNVHEEGVLEGHRRMLAEAARTLAFRVAERRGEPQDEWDRNACSLCFKLHGAPHWTRTGAVGAVAHRERWRGAWAPPAADG